MPSRNALNDIHGYHLSHVGTVLPCGDAEMDTLRKCNDDVWDYGSLENKEESKEAF